MPVQATVILDSGCFLPYTNGRTSTDIGYFQSARSAADIRVIADGQEMTFDELKNLGKNCVIEIRHVKTNGSTYDKGTTSSPTFHDELLHMKDLYGEHMEVDEKKFDCILRFNAGRFCGALVKPRKFKLHRKQADGKYAHSPDDAPKLVNRPIAHNVHVHFKLKNGEAIELARDGQVFWSSQTADAKDRLEIEIIADNSTAEKFYRHALKSKLDSYWLPNQGDPPPVCPLPPCDSGDSGTGGTGGTGG
ncbi:MAG TPA: hypothetical protein VKA60_13045 [Blastocatellia bacterium]|nr:hypothetical protein [Blastocatellia bacterium]